MPGEQKKVCIDVPYIDQSKLYPTGCESVSTVMLLRFLGIDITVDEFIEKYLEKKSFEERDGVTLITLRIIVAALFHAEAGRCIADPTRSKATSCFSLNRQIKWRAQNSDICISVMNIIADRYFSKSRNTSRCHI